MCMIYVGFGRKNHQVMGYQAFSDVTTCIIAVRSGLMTYTYIDPESYHGDLWYTENDKKYVVSMKGSL